MASITGSTPVRTFALVVGIEKYDEGPDWDLNGPASDATKFTDWLLAQQIPAENIRLFLSPLDKNASLLDRPKPSAAPATRENIYKALTSDLRSKDGDLIYIFWSGHGIVDTDRTRRLIYADATHETMQNLDLMSLLVSLTSDYFPAFPRQVGFVDTCANYVTDLREAYTLPTEVFPRTSSFLPREQFLLLAAREGEIAENISSRATGLFTEKLLEELAQVSKTQWPPDMAALAAKLKEIFDELRKKNPTVQTPSYIQSMGGDDVKLGVVPNKSMPQQPALPHEDLATRLQRRTLKQQLALLTKQYAAVNQDLLTTIDPELQVVLDLKLKSLNKKI
ncbi:MAG TPA: caspase family protein, partial [Chloroflexia bacterium]|nr:caspase family protein [Chloroflexia bacterium]